MIRVWTISHDRRETTKSRNCLHHVCVTDALSGVSLAREVHMPKTTPPRPAVSVIIPAYRASRDIADALASVFAQTFTDFEVIVVDDGSPDAAELEVAVAPFRSRIQLIVQANRGAGAARNTGIRASTGRLIAFLDADDLW